MNKYCAREEINVNSIIESTSLSDEAAAVVRRLGLPTLLNIYCTRGKRFEADPFNNEMEKMGVPALDYHVLYDHVDTLRRNAVTDSQDTFVSPLTEGSASKK